MTKFYATLLSFVAAPKKDEKGATAVEYGLLVALIAAAIIVAVTLFGTNLSTLFNSVAGELV
ncbi:Flp family type IVb pilin [Aeromicrobium sp. Leaf350]|uniref:Flp family type IVb pilin n=1 Tax=Aeromicrobium sp. Leaf350 TaxID=2876565 RepID=UPI001E46E4CF|nr:Flp family type IVb pilin [Aeromicrobium sp. Leaf350]